MHTGRNDDRLRLRLRTREYRVRGGRIEAGEIAHKRRNERQAAGCPAHRSVGHPAQFDGATGDPGDEYICRYAEFVTRQGLFTRGYDTANADVVALITEYGVIVAVAAILYLLLGIQRSA